MSFDALRPSVTAVNFHLWQPCNMRCRYCFAGFESTVERLREDKSQLRDRALSVVHAAAAAGVEKVTFVGGEPLLCPWLSELVELASRRGLVTMVVTNGTRVTPGWIAEHARWLRWVAISVDSLVPEVNRRIGRVVGRSCPPDEPYYANLMHALSAQGIRTKVNTVVSALNWQEDFTAFIRRVRPERWKVLQALHIAGENDAAFPALGVSSGQFAAFVERHRSLAGELMLATEDNEAMTSSYLMVDPLGRFFTNMGGRYRYSQPIWEVGWGQARAQVEVDVLRFVARGGRYEW
jgi:radical S-adenosyl methionine domain-containing protein 2